MFLKWKKQKVDKVTRKQTFFPERLKSNLLHNSFFYYYFYRRDDKHKPWEKEDYDSEKTEKDRNAKNFRCPSCNARKSRPCLKGQPGTSHSPWAGYKKTATKINPITYLTVFCRGYIFSFLNKRTVYIVFFNLFL